MTKFEMFFFSNSTITKLLKNPFPSENLEHGYIVAYFLLFSVIIISRQAIKKKKIKDCSKISFFIYLPSHEVNVTLSCDPSTWLLQ